MALRYLSNRTFAAHFKLIAVATGLGIAALVTGCGSKELSEAPPRGGKVAAPETRESTIGTALTLPYTYLSNEANKKAPADFSRQGRQSPCKRIGPKGDLPFGGSYDLTKNVCMDVDYNVTVRRGAISVGPGSAQNMARVTVPINVDGWAGFTGSLAKVLKLDRKNFTASINAYVDVAADVGPDWCPKLTGAPGFTWNTPAKIEIVGGVWIPIDGLVSNELQSRLIDLKNGLESSVNCATTKTELEKIWTTRSIPFSLPDKSNVFINIEPTGMAFSGIVATPSALELSLQTKGKVAVATTAIGTVPRPLPVLERLPLAPGRITLAVPLRAGYAPLTTALQMQLRDKQFAADTPAGKVTVTLQDIQVYPSQDKLVVGLKFKAKVPGKIFDVSGDVFVFGQPKSENDGKLVAVRDVKFSRILDNDLWSVVSAIFENQIRNEIAKAAVFDMAASITEAHRTLDAKLNEVQAQSGTKIILNERKIALGRIVPGDQELLVEAIFEATAIVTLGMSS